MSSYFVSFKYLPDIGHFSIVIIYKFNKNKMLDGIALGHIERKNIELNISMRMSKMFINVTMINLDVNMHPIWQDCIYYIIKIVVMIFSRNEQC